MKLSIKDDGSIEVDGEGAVIKTSKNYISLSQASVTLTGFTFEYVPEDFGKVVDGVRVSVAKRYKALAYPIRVSIRNGNDEGVARTTEESGYRTGAILSIKEVRDLIQALTEAIAYTEKESKNAL